MLINFNDIADIRRDHSNQKVVLLSGDKQIKAWKGSKRPIINEGERARILDSLKIVDYVLIDPSKLSPNETDPIHAEIIKKLKPDFYVTDGPDPRFYNLINKSQFIILDRMNPESSTTSIICRILRTGN